MNSEMQWYVTCRDEDGRRADIAVRPEGSQVVLVSPSGEETVLRLLEVGRLRASLRAAAAVAGVQRNPSPDTPQ